MEIEYELTLADIQAFLRFHQKHGPKRKPHSLVKLVSKGLAWVMGLLGFLAYWFFVQHKGGWMSGCCAGMVIGIVITFAYFLWQVKLAVRDAVRLYEGEECRWMLARRRLKITADGFEIMNQFQQVRSSWSVVWLIDSTDEHAFFYWSMTQAYIFPRRAFRDQRHFEDFIDLACRYHKGLGPRESASDVILDALPAEQTGITRPPRS
jgi:hypothetical protein